MIIGTKFHFLIKDDLVPFSEINLQTSKYNFKPEAKNNTNDNIQLSKIKNVLNNRRKYQTL